MDGGAMDMDRILTIVKTQVHGWGAMDVARRAGGVTTTAPPCWWNNNEKTDTAVLVE